MWRRMYLVLLVVRLYFALQPSYIHPDECFQGPEQIAGEVFGYPIHKTWEFTTQYPIRSIFPLWLVYGLPMFVLRWLWQGFYHEEVPPYLVYWTLRVLMLLLSFVLEDWAVQELVHSPRQRRLAVVLVASSYVTWTYQTHTFSNAIETLLVLWSLVIIDRIAHDRERSGAFACGILAFLCVLGVFNRITFPAYILVPGLRLLPHFKRKPLGVLVLIIFALATVYVALLLDTAFYQPETVTFRSVFQKPVITPLNNLLYNAAVHNLAEHGLHPYYQHLVANLPQLLGPAMLFMLFGLFQRNMLTVSAASGVLMLSAFPHQEARFLIPAVPLILASLKWPQRLSRFWVVIWVVFNAAFGLLMGTYHQGGVVPMQIHIADQGNVTHAFWWKTYSPPIWLLDGQIENVTTTDLMGRPAEEMVQEILNATPCSILKDSPKGVYLVAPWSATYLDQFTTNSAKNGFILEERWRYDRHLHLDDLDFEQDGIGPTLTRVVGRRGLVLWQVERQC